MGLHTMQENIEAFDLLSPLSMGHGHHAVSGSCALLTMENGETMVDLNEMRVVLGQQNTAFIQAMEQAVTGFTAPKDGRSGSKKDCCSIFMIPQGGVFKVLSLLRPVPRLRNGQCAWLEK